MHSERNKLQLADFATLSEAATLAGISKRTLQNHMHDATAPRWERKGREVLFVISEVLAWAASNYPDDKPRQGRRKK